MTVQILVGDDSYAINQQIVSWKRSLDPTWQAFNFHRFAADQLREAIATARTPPLGDVCRVVVVECCQFNHWGESQLELLQSASQLPQTTALLFTATSIDKRLKVVKHLLKYGTLQELMLIPPWRTDLIREAIARQARAFNLTLSREVLLYLAEAIGNDTARITAELKKLATYARDRSLSQRDVEQLVPCQTQTNLQLAEAMRQGDMAQTLRLLNELLGRAEVPLVIVATLTTQFRTWLWVKSALSDRTKHKDTEIAQLCGIGNPRRLFYLRQEVAKLSVIALAQAVTQLLELEVLLKQGEGRSVLLPALAGVARLFRQ